jgi:hypothetical protein
MARAVRLTGQTARESGGPGRLAVSRGQAVVDATGRLPVGEPSLEELAGVDLEDLAERQQVAELQIHAAAKKPR